MLSWQQMILRHRRSRCRRCYRTQPRPVPEPSQSPLSAVLKCCPFSCPWDDSKPVGVPSDPEPQHGVFPPGASCLACGPHWSMSRCGPGGPRFMDTALRVGPEQGVPSWGFLPRLRAFVFVFSLAPLSLPANSVQGTHLTVLPFGRHTTCVVPTGFQPNVLSERNLRTRAFLFVLTNRPFGSPGSTTATRTAGTACGRGRWRPVKSARGIVLPVRRERLGRWAVDQMRR